MNESRRKLIKSLPLVALAATSVKIGDTNAQAYELKPQKKYLFVIPGLITQQDAENCSKTLRDRGIDGVVCCGQPDLKIYEIQ